MLPEGAVRPDYAGRGLANLPTSAVSPFLRLPEALPPLSEDVLPRELLDGAERVVLLVLDGLGWDQLRAHVEAEPDLGLATVVREGHAASATSVSPSTTVAALATLATGVAPLAHGLLGYRTFFPSLGLTANAIQMTPVLGGPNLLDAGVDPALLLPPPTIYERLAEAGVDVAAFTRAPFARSPLTRVIYRGVEPTGALGIRDMLVGVRKRLDAARGKRAFIRAYYDHVDGVAHAHGPDSPEHAAEVTGIAHALQTHLLDEVRDPGTLLLVTADHGHVTIAPDRVVSLNRHPGLLQDLALPPTGEGRFAYLHVRDGRREAVRAYCETHLAHAGAVLDQAKLVSSGLYGPPERAHPEASGRLGDLALAAREGYRFTYDVTATHAPPALVGHHGGLLEGEMRVPLLAMRLG